MSTSLYLDLNENLPDVSEYEKEFSKAESDYKKGLLSDITFENTCQRLNPLIAEGHDYHFIGKVGQFCPIKAGRGGGLLVREKDGKYYAATSAKGYRWLESEMVRKLDKTADIDRTYYDKLVNEAVEAISQYDDFEWFVSDDPYISSFGANDGDMDDISFSLAGAYLVDGFVNGISANTYKAAAQAKAMASAAVVAAKKELDEHSPSKVFYGIGDFAGKGFINALAD